MAQIVKNLPAMQETGVRSLGQKNPLEKEMATHFSILDWKIPRTEESGGLQSMGSQRVGHDLAPNIHIIRLIFLLGKPCSIYILLMYVKMLLH